MSVFDFPDFPISHGGHYVRREDAPSRTPAMPVEAKVTFMQGDRVEFEDVSSLAPFWLTKRDFRTHFEPKA